MTRPARSLVLLAAGLVTSACGGDAPGAEYDLTVEEIALTREADDHVDVEVPVLCTATEYTRISDPSTGRPGTCPASEWCLAARWYPRSALGPAPREEGGELRFDVALSAVTFTGEPVGTAESCQTDSARPLDGVRIIMSATSAEPVMGTDLVASVVVSRRQADVPGELLEHAHDILISP